MTSFYKLGIELLLFFLYIFSFNKIYAILIKNIYASKSETTASDYYSLMKLLSNICLFIIGSIFLILNTTTKNAIFVVLEFIIFILLIIFTKSSIHLMDHLINFIYMPNLLEDKNCYCIVGSIEYINKEWIFNHIISNLSFSIVSNF